MFLKSNYVYITDSFEMFLLLAWPSISLAKLNNITISLTLRRDGLTEVAEVNSNNVR